MIKKTSARGLANPSAGYFVLPTRAAARTPRASALRERVTRDRAARGVPGAQLFARAPRDLAAWLGHWRFTYLSGLIAADARIRGLTPSTTCCTRQLSYRNPLGERTLSVIARAAPAAGAPCPQPSRLAHTGQVQPPSAPPILRNEGRGRRYHSRIACLVPFSNLIP